MIAQSEIQDRVVKVTARVLGLDPATIKSTDNFVFDLGAESSQSIELVAAFEEEFGIEMDQEAALAVVNVSGAAEFIGRHLSR